MMIKHNNHHNNDNNNNDNNNNDDDNDMMMIHNSNSININRPTLCRKPRALSMELTVNRQ